MRLAVGVNTFPVAPEAAGQARPAVPVPLSVRANFSWTLAGNVVYAACQWTMLVAIAKLGSPEMVGQFAVASALIVPVLMFLNLQLRAVEATDAKGAYRLTDYLGLRLMTTTIALGVIGLLASTRRWEVLWVILAVGAAKAVDSLSDILYGLLQQHERMDRVACSMMIRGPLGLAALAGVLMLTGRVAWAALAMAAAWLLVLLAYDLPNAVWLLRRRTFSEPGRVGPAERGDTPRLGVALSTRDSINTCLRGRLANRRRLPSEVFHGSSARIRTRPSSAGGSSTRSEPSLARCVGSSFPSSWTTHLRPRPTANSPSLI